MSFAVIAIIHPLWCGADATKEFPPALNDMLIAMLHQEDGTRLYFPSSNVIDLRPSGPYKWRDPSLYFSTGNRGFSVELGTSSFPTLQAFEHTVAPQDRWPLSDAWAYHDWHQSKGGDTHELMHQLDLQLGPSTSLAEFERRIQLFNYVDHQAIFEGMYAHLWSPNSGRMIWMTQPAWPSTMWQMYSSDYDTQASFYGVKKANAPLHVQMDLSDYTVAAVNTTLEDQKNLHITAKVVSPDDAMLDTENVTVDADANTVTPALHLPIPALTQKDPLVFVRLEMHNEKNDLIADNFYWIARKAESYQRLNNLAPASIEAQVSRNSPVQSIRNQEDTWTVHLKNIGTTPSIAMKLTLFRSDNTRVLPAYYSDNYLSLLPGEQRTIVIHAPAQDAGSGSTRVTLEGWNLAERDVPETSMQSTIARR